MYRQLQQQSFALRFQDGAFINAYHQTFDSQAQSQTALLLIDLQKDFKAASDERLLSNVCRLIERAIAKNWLIITLEVTGYGETLPPIIRSLSGYGNKITVSKYGNDGTAAVLQRLKAMQVSITRYIAAGVNASACVRETVSGLAYSHGHPSVDVIQEACGDPVSPHWELYPEACHIRLLPRLQ